MSKLVVNSEKLLSAVQDLIDSGKYKKITGRYVGVKNPFCRCWYGLVLKVLEDQGLVKVYNGQVTATEFGLKKHPDLNEYIGSIDFTTFGIPRHADRTALLKEYGTLLLYNLNDSTDLSFQDIQDIVCRSLANT